MTRLQRAFLTGFVKVATLTTTLPSPVHALPPSLSSPMMPSTTRLGPAMIPQFTANSQVPQLHVPIQPSPAKPTSWFNNFNPKAFVDKAIRPAEGNPNYGVLRSFKNTTNEQASMNTVSHALKEFQARGGGSQSDFIKFLGRIYAPVKGATNDPRHLNRNWVPNVQKFWNNYNATNR